MAPAMAERMRPPWRPPYPWGCWTRSRRCSKAGDWRRGCRQRSNGWRETSVTRWTRRAWPPSSAGVCARPGCRSITWVSICARFIPRSSATPSPGCPTSRCGSIAGAMTSFTRRATSTIPSSGSWRRRPLPLCASTRRVVLLGLRLIYSEAVPLWSSSSSPCAHQTHCPAPFRSRRRAAPASPPPSAQPSTASRRRYAMRASCAT